MSLRKLYYLNLQISRVFQDLLPFSVLENARLKFKYFPGSVRTLFKVRKLKKNLHLNINCLGFIKTN